jgi:hypothetical protein
MMSPYGVDTGKSAGVGDAGVGGGGLGVSEASLSVFRAVRGLDIGVRDVFAVFGVSVPVSVSEPEESSSSQLSATGLDLALTADFEAEAEDEVEMVRCESVSATSGVRVSVLRITGC